MLETRVTHTFTCNACRDVEIQKFKALPGCDMPHATLPEGWTEMEGQHFCPEHKIEIRVDGEKLTESR